MKNPRGIQNQTHSLRFRISFMLIGLFIIFGLGIGLLAKRIILNSYLDLETADSRQDILRVTELLKREREYLQTLSTDWSRWDDSYEFVLTGDETYIDTNLYVDYLAELDLQMIYFLDDRGRVVWGTGYDSSSGEKFDYEKFSKGSLPLDDALIGIDLTGQDVPDDRIEGFIATEKGIIRVITSPIIRSSGEGPAVGFLIFGKLLDESQIRDQVQLDVRVLPLTGTSSVADLKAGLRFDNGYYYEQDSETRQIFHFVDDIYDSPLFAIRLDYPRSIFGQGLRVIRLSIRFLSLLSIAVLVLIRLMLGRMILRPLKVVIGNIREATSRGDYSRRLNLSRNDEIGVLGDSLDHLMRTIMTQTSSLEKMNQRLTELADTDQLTKLPNRRKLDEHLDKELGRINRNRRKNVHKGRIGFILCDIDHFKFFNDTYGHQSGDECLARIAGVLAACTHRPADLASRFGGEEFAVVLPDTDLTGTRIVAEKIRSAVAELAIPNERSPVAPNVTVSVGIACFSMDEEMLATNLIRSADEALYRAKANGKNRIEE